MFFCEFKQKYNEKDIFRAILIRLILKVVEHYHIVIQCRSFELRGFHILAF